MYIFFVKYLISCTHCLVVAKYTHSVLIRNGPIRNTSEIFGFLKKRLVKFSKLRNPTAQFFQSKKQQRFCIYYILKKNT